MSDYIFFVGNEQAYHMFLTLCENVYYSKVNLKNIHKQLCL